MENPTTSLSATISPVCRDNEAWLGRECQGVLDSAVGLVNDAIDAIPSGLNPAERAEARERSALHFFTYHVLLPGSYSIALNLLAGGLPSCFRELRFMTEMAGKCYLADGEFPELEGLSNQPAFKAKLDAVERKFSKPVKEFDRRLALRGSATALWAKMSDELHGKGYVERLVKNVLEHQNMPGYGLVIPYRYGSEDKPDLLELGKYVERLRDIVRVLKPAFSQPGGPNLKA